MMKMGGDVDNFVESVKTFVKTHVPMGAVWHIHGSPPCQSFSICQRQNKDHDVEKDERSNLTTWFFRVLEALNPPRWSFEQVPGVLKFLRTHVPWVFEDKEVHIWPACYGYQFGAPTMRKRLYMGKGWTFDGKTASYGTRKRRKYPGEHTLGLYQARPDICDAILLDLKEKTWGDSHVYTVRDVAVSTSANKWVLTKKERELPQFEGKTNKWVPKMEGQGLRLITGMPIFACISSYPLVMYKRKTSTPVRNHKSHQDGTWEKFRALKPSESAAIQGFPASYKIDKGDLPSKSVMTYHTSIQSVGTPPCSKKVQITMTARTRVVGNAVIPLMARAIFKS